ncbi:MAG: MFS transporter [Candidatus Thalassarchaeaceae archaeon]|jgi:DHA1 family tetracycline resistance protein-like MFS transporter|nr:MFS transporter [Candidatus Thalassarchaeaceae archaeon]
MGSESNARGSMSILFLVVLIDMIGFTLVIPFLTYFIQDLAHGDGFTDIGTRDRWVGIVLAAYTFGQFIFTPILGTLSDSVGRRPIILFGLISNTIFLISFGLSGSLWFALLVRFLAGAGNGNIAVARAYVGDISTPEQTAGRMGLIGAAFGLGFMIGPFIGGVLTDPATSFGGFFDTEWWKSHPYFLPCLFAGSLSATSFVFALRYLPESLPLQSRTVIDSNAPKGFKRVLNNLLGVRDLNPQIRTLILVNALFLLSFTMMHATFILFTGMEIVNGGLGYDAYQNGLIFAYVGLIGVIVQGGLIRPLVRRYNPRHLMVMGIFICGIGLGWIPYLEPTPFAIGLVAMTCIAVGNGLFQPTQNTLITFEARFQQLDLGRVMGAQEGFGALSRVIGPVFAAFVWAETVDGTGFWTYHTVFRICAIIMAFAIIAQIRMKLSMNSEEE